MSGIIKQSFSINLNVLTMFGLYRSEKRTYLNLLHTYSFYFIFAYPIPIFGVFYFIFEKEIDAMRLGDDGFLVAETACHITKLLPFITNVQRIKECINYLENPLFEVKNQKQEILLEKCVRTCRRNSTVFLYSVIASLASWSLKPLLGNERRLPVDIWLPFSINNRTYFLIFALQVLCVGYASIASAAIDPLIGGLACLASGHLQILKKDLQNLNKDAAGVNKTFSIRNKIKQCIIYHNAILIFVKKYEQCFSSSVFSQFVGSVLVICFCCLQLNKVSPMTFNFVSMILHLTVMLVQIYFYCHYGTMVYEESNTLINAVYLGEWYECDIRTRKDLIILMEHCKRPIVISAGKILELSVITFAGILRKSYSLLAVLKNQ